MRELMKGKWTIRNAFARMACIVVYMGVPYGVLWWLELLLLEERGIDALAWLRPVLPQATSGGLAACHFIVCKFLELVHYIINRILQKRDARSAGEPTETPSVSDATEPKDEP